MRRGGRKGGIIHPFSTVQLMRRKENGGQNSEKQDRSKKEKKTGQFRGLRKKKLEEEKQGKGVKY